MVDIVKKNSNRMLALVTACVVFTLGSAQEHHCCTPDVWQGELHSAAGYITSGSYDPKYVHQRDFVIYDYLDKLASYYHHSMYEDGTDRSFRMLAHFSTKKGYFIEENTCQTFNLTREMRRFCIPNTANSTRPIFYGAGEHTIKADRYYDRLMDGDKDIGAKMFTVTRNGCIPVETVEYREGYGHGPGAKSDVVRGGTYANIDTDIDREALEPPATCVEAHMPAELDHLPMFQHWLDLITE